jgi:hypothetical protein
LRDSFGNSFDPELHAVTRRNKPKLTKHGKLRVKPFLSKKAQERAGAEPATIQNDSKQEAFSSAPAETFLPESTIRSRNEDILNNLRAERATEQERAQEEEKQERAQEEEKQEQAKQEEQTKLQTQGLAEVCTGLFISAGTALVGSKFQPSEKTTEREDLRLQFEAYLSTRPELDIPPGWALAIGLGMYTINHTAGPPEPNTWWQNFKNRWTLRKEAKRAQKAEAARQKAKAEAQSQGAIQ